MICDVKRLFYKLDMHVSVTYNRYIPGLSGLLFVHPIRTYAHESPSVSERGLSVIAYRGQPSEMSLQRECQFLHIFIQWALSCFQCNIIRIECLG